MTSITNGSGLNFQNGNPLGRKVRALEAEVIELRKELTVLKLGGVSNTSVVNNVSPTLNADIESLKRDIAIIKAAGYGKGEKGEKGDKGERGEKGEPGPMTYIAMPAGAALPTAATN